MVGADDLGFNYHPEKANVVADALSRRSHVSQLVVDNMSLRIPKPWRWKWVQAYFKRFEEANWNIRRSKR
jgi:hypothetical protein